MQSQLRVATYDDDSGLYAENLADRARDPLDAHPAIRELQVASRASILRGCQNPANVVVKVTAAGPHYAQVRGYATLARFIEGATPQQLEKLLGMRDGALSSGCRVYWVDAARLTADNIGPRYMTSWSAGVSPRDLEVLSQQAGKTVGYHRDYPAASDPIPQFVLYRPVPALRSLVLAAGERFSTSALAG